MLLEINQFFLILLLSKEGLLRFRHNEQRSKHPGKAIRLWEHVKKDIHHAKENSCRDRYQIQRSIKHDVGGNAYIVIVLIKRRMKMHLLPCERNNVSSPYKC